MCPYCNPDGKSRKPIRNDSNGMVLVAEDVHNKSHVLIQVIEVWRGLFGRPKYAHHLIDFGIKFCPMCGRDLRSEQQD